MPNDKPLGSLDTFKRSTYSQHGEDGIVEEILKRISTVSTLNGWCVEFGAWDGIHLSNAYNLIRNRNYRAVLIEGDRKKYNLLCKNIPSADVIKIRQFVTFDGDSTLDRILNETPIPLDFDFLSIDIDGCDYFILESLTKYQPKLLCVEFNPTIPNDVAFIQPKNFSVKQGSSAKSLTLLARSKGYSLVATTPCNLLFVRSSLIESVLGSSEQSLDDLRDDSQCKTYVYCGYDGTILTSAPMDMPWHGMRVTQNSLQQLPRFLRKFPGDYKPLQRLFFAILSELRSKR